MSSVSKPTHPPAAVPVSDSDIDSDDDDEASSQSGSEVVAAAPDASMEEDEEEDQDEEEPQVNSSDDDEEKDADGFTRYDHKHRAHVVAHVLEKRAAIDAAGGLKQYNVIQAKEAEERMHAREAKDKRKKDKAPAASSSAAAAAAGAASSESKHKGPASRCMRLAQYQNTPEVKKGEIIHINGRTLVVTQGTKQGWKYDATKKKNGIPPDPHSVLPHTAGNTAFVHAQDQDDLTKFQSFSWTPSDNTLWILNAPPSRVIMKTAIDTAGGAAKFSAMCLRDKNVRPSAQASLGASDIPYVPQSLYEYFLSEAAKKQKALLDKQADPEHDGGAAAAAATPKKRKSPGSAAAAAAASAEVDKECQEFCDLVLEPVLRANADQATTPSELLYQWTCGVENSIKNDTREEKIADANRRFAVQQKTEGEFAYNEVMRNKLFTSDGGRNALKALEHKFREEDKQETIAKKAKFAF